MISLNDALIDILKDFKDKVKEEINKEFSNVDVSNLDINLINFDSDWITIVTNEIKIEHNLGTDAFFIAIQKINGNYYTFTLTNNNDLFVHFDDKYVYVIDPNRFINFSSNYKTDIRIIGFKIKNK